MITNLSLGSDGRLGNQLFQYAALRGLGWSNNYRVLIPDPAERQWHGQPCLLDKFNIPFDYLQQKDLRKIKYFYHEPDYMNVDTNFYSLQDGACLKGYFQSIYYFKDCIDNVKEHLTPKKEYLIEANNYIEKIKQENDSDFIVSVHLRRGDNTDHSNPSVELNTMYGTTEEDFSSSFYGKYFFNAKDCFPKNTKFLIFSGGKRFSDSNEEDMAWCKTRFKGKEYLFSEKGSTIQDYSRIMACDGHILSHVSSFGWWAAFVDKKGGQTVAPLQYHPDKPEFTYRPMFYPKEWKKV